MTGAVNVFFSYSHKDEALRNELEKHLSVLKRQGLISAWHDRKIGAGAEWEKSIDANLKAAHIILLLVSADFLASDYCWDMEMQEALRQHEAGEACVMPIILKPVRWQGSPFGKLQALPKDAKPVSRWSDPNEAFVEIADAIATVAERLLGCEDKRPSPPPQTQEPSSQVIAPNPFGITGQITDPDQFFGREELMRQIFEELGKGGNISLVGARGIGKSSILRQLCIQGPRHFRALSETTVEFVYLNLQWIEDEDDFYYALCEELKIAECRGFKLTRTLKNSGRRYMLCLDEIEKMVWDEAIGQRCRSQLRGLADGSEMPLKLIIASRSSLANLFPDSPDLDSPLAGICRHLDVKPFSEEGTKRFVSERLQLTGVNFSTQELDRLWKDTKGHPAQLQRAAADFYARLT